MLKLQNKGKTPRINESPRKKWFGDENLLSMTQKVQKIVIIGHSMGGIVIQYAMMLEDFIVERVAFIIGFAVPYSEPRKFIFFIYNLSRIVVYFC